MTETDPVIRLEPLVQALRQERYAYIEDLHIWDMPLNHEELASLVITLSRSHLKIFPNRGALTKM